MLIEQERQYYRDALESIRLQLTKPLEPGETFSIRKAFVLGYIDGALKMKLVEPSGQSGK